MSKHMYSYITCVDQYIIFAKHLAISGDKEHIWN